MKTNKPENHFDDFDLRLIAELELDARKTSSDLAKELGTSAITVRKRLKRLMDNNIITFATVTSPTVVGYLSRAVIALNVSAGKSDAVAAQLAPCGNIQNIIATSGRYDMIVALIIRDLDDLLRFVTETLGGITEIIHTEVMLSLKQLKYDWPYLGAKEFVAEQIEKTQETDALDREIIKALEANPRESVSSLARDLAVNRAIISKRMQELVEGGTVRIICVPELAALGYKLWTAIQIKTELSDINTVAEKLTQYRDVTHVTITTGSFNISISAVFKNREDMFHFVNVELGNIPGVLQHETLVNLKDYKRSFNLLSQMDK